MKIAIVQMTSVIDPAANAATLVAGIHAAASGGAVMAFAPEMSALLDRDRARAAPHLVSEAASPFVATIRAAAAQAGIWVHCGSLPVREGAAGERLRNRTLIIDDQGDIRARYDKLHMFDVDLATGESWRESSAYAPGDAVVMVDTPVGALGLTICYDLRFAALFDQFGAAGADVIAVPAAFTVPTGEAHWHVMLRARAIDQGCFIIAAAQCGTHEDGRATYGHSLVVDPWGRILLDMGSVPGVGFAEIDHALATDIRRRLPLVAHRRPLPPLTWRESE